MIKGFEPRLYQQTIFASSVKYNTLVVLPTGMGKTFIFLLLAAQRLQQYPNSKILFIGPTRPLIDQYLEVFKKNFDIDHEKLAVFTGHVSPKKRAELWDQCQIFFSTPQGLENDIISNRIKLEDVSLLGVDEAHRAVGDYAYVFVAKQYMKKANHPRLLALTASPGSDLEKISEVVQNLHIEEIEVRTDDDPDVKEYIQEVDLKWVKVKLPPPFLDIKKFLDEFVRERLKKLKGWGVLQRANLNYVNKTELLRLQAQIRGKISQGEKDYTLWNAISVLAEIMKVHHASELLETQGVSSLLEYMEKLERESYGSSSKAVKNLVKDLNFRSALIKTRTLAEDRAEHPKLVELQRIIEKEVKDDAKVIVFNQYRDNASDIVDKLNAIDQVQAELFIGQQKRGGKGLSQKQQKDMLDRFRDGEFNVLVATSVGEEGLDIPKVDAVIFFEPVPSAIRHIQRKGRTGRLEKGKVLILMAEDTRDVGYKWSAHHKQKRMYSNLKSLRTRLQSVLNVRKEKTLDKFIPEEDKIKVIVDHREKGSAVVKALLDLDASLSLEQLQNADFILSNRVGVEFKTVEDFVESIVDGRLMDQVKELKRNFARPLVIVEGINDIYSVRNLHPNSIRGMFANITISYGIPVIQTKSPRETAALLHIIAKREQDETGKDFMPHTLKRVTDTKWLQEYIVSSLPGIGATLAKPLLDHFKSIRKIVNASVDELQKVEGIGKGKAEEIQRILDEEY